MPDLIAKQLSPARLESGHFMAGLWTASRVGILLWWAIMRFSLGDTRYYFQQMVSQADRGPGGTMVEYPTPVLWMFDALFALSFGHRVVFVMAFVLLMLAFDAVFALALWRSAGRLRGRAVLFWSVFLFLVGPTALLRFDLITAVLSGLALLGLIRHRSLLGGALIGTGAAIKLWPALLWPALLVDDRVRQQRASIGFWGAGALLALLSLWYAGWDRLISPLTWQSDRGLQIESVWASVPMVMRLFRPDDYRVAISRYNAFEVSGPGTELMLTLSTIATVVGLLLTVVGYLWWLRKRNRSPLQAAGFMVLVVLVMIVTNKTFSPQYVMWLGGPVAASIALVAARPESATSNPDGRPNDEQQVARSARWLLLITALTTLVYPIFYSPIVHHSFGVTPMTLVLATRNVMLLVLSAAAIAWLWRSLSTSGEQPEVDNDAG